MKRKSTEIKKILKENFPEATFRVRIKEHKDGTTVFIDTDLLPKFLEEEIRDYIYYSSGKIKQETELAKWAQEKINKTNEIEEKLYTLVKTHFPDDDLFIFFDKFS